MIPRREDYQGKAKTHEVFADHRHPGVGLREDVSAEVAAAEALDQSLRLGAGLLDV